MCWWPSWTKCIMDVDVGVLQNSESYGFTVFLHTHLSISASLFRFGHFFAIYNNTANTPNRRTDERMHARIHSVIKDTRTRTHRLRTRPTKLCRCPRCSCKRRHSEKYGKTIPNHVKMYAIKLYCVLLEEEEENAKLINENACNWSILFANSIFLRFLRL